MANDGNAKQCKTQSTKFTAVYLLGKLIDLKDSIIGRNLHESVKPYLCIYIPQV